MNQWYTWLPELRSKPIQFRLGTSLILITFISICLASYRGCSFAVNEADVRRIQIGMTQAEVLAILGNPHDHGRDANGFHMYYRYAEKSPEDDLLFIHLDKKGLVNLIRARWGLQMSTPL